MNILAIDTSTKKTHITLSVRSNQPESFTSEDNNSHSEEIARATLSLLSQKQVDIGGVDLIILGKGPGSFTGLRIACSFVQGLSINYSCNIITIHSHRAAAYSIDDLQHFDAISQKAGKSSYYMTPIVYQHSSKKIGFRPTKVVSLQEREGKYSPRRIIASEDCLLSEGLLRAYEKDPESIQPVENIEELEMEYLIPVKAKTLLERGL